MMKRSYIFPALFLFLTLLLIDITHANAQVTATCKNITVDLSPTGQVTIDGTDIDNGSSKDTGCNSSTLIYYSLSRDVFNCSDILTPVSVTLTVTDSCSNTGTCVSVVTVNDTETPTAVCQDITVSLNGDGNATISANFIDNNSGDNCTFGLSIDVSSFTCTAIGSNNVILTVTDASNNSATCTASVTIQDITLPTVLCQDMTVILDGTGNGSLTAAAVDNGSTDACGIATIVLSQTSFACSNVGINAVILTVTDNNSNIATCSASVLVQDSEAPIMQCQNVTIFLDASGNGSTTASAVDNGSSDACGIATMVLSQTSFSCTDIGTNPVTLTVTDNNNNFSTCAQIITVTDTIYPVALCQAITVSLDVTGNASITASQVDDNSRCISNLSIDISSFTCTEVGANDVILTVTDLNNNTATCIAAVTIQDATLPTVLCQDVTVILDGTGNVSLTAAAVDNGSTDACGIATIVLSQTSFACSSVGINAVILTVTDNNSNIATCSASVLVQDNEAPTIQCQNVTIFLDASGNGSTTASAVDNGSADACGIATMVLSQTSFSCADIGTNLLTLTVTDNNNNISTCGQTITVIDTMYPVALCRAITVSLDATGNASITAGQVNDNSHCISNLSIDIPSFTCTEVGANDVILTVTDLNNNTATCTAVVTIQDITPPTVLCQDVTLMLDASNNATTTAGAVDNGSNDACGIATMVLSQTAFTCGNVGTNPVTLTVTDNNNNVSTCSQTILVVDTVYPTAICKDITVALNISGTISITANDIDNNSYDNCPIGLSIDISSFSCADAGANNVVLTATDANNNTSTCSAIVTIQDITPPSALCQDITVSLDNTGTASITASQIDDNSGDNCTFGLSIDISSFTCTGAGANNVILTVTDASNNTASCLSVVTIQDIIAPLALCQDITVSLDNAGNANITASQVNDNSGDNCTFGLSIDISSFTCAEAGANNVILTVTDASNNTVSCVSVVTVQDIIAPSALCQDITVSLDNAGNASVLASQVNDNSGDNCTFGLSIDVSSFTCTETGVNNVILTVTDASNNTGTCTTTVTVLDDEKPVANCTAITVTLNAGSYGLSTTDVSDIGGASTDNCAPLNLSVSPETFDCTPVGSNSVTMTVTDPSNNTAQCVTTVFVKDVTAPTASFNVSNVCLGTAATFKNNSTNASTYYWTFGDGSSSTSANPSYTYNTTGTFAVTLTARNAKGCEHSYSMSISIYAVPSVSFTATTVCEGTATTFTNNSSVSSGSLTYAWTFGNGNSSTATNPTHTYGGPGTFNVTLIARTNNNCSESYSANVNVNAMPISNFSLNNACINTAVTFANTSTGASSYIWDFGNGSGSTASNPSYSYPTAGTFTVKLTATSASNCVAVSSKSITIYPNPVANYTTSNVCQGQAMNFTNSSTGASTYRWEFGNGFVSGASNPSYTYPSAGTYNVLLTATSANGCKNDVTKSVTVYSQSVADFTVGNVCFGTSASFTNLTSGTNSYTWNFGDATSSNATNPTKNYSAAGTYNVQLTAVNANNCNSSITKQIIVFAAPTAAFTTSDKCVGESVLMSNTSTGAVIYDWSFGDNTSSSSFAPEKRYNAAGTYTVTLKATSTNNCSNIAARTVTINPNPVAAFTAAANCTDATAVFTNNSSISSGTITSNWLFGDGANSSVSSPTHTYPASGTYMAILNVQSALGCKASTNSTVAVFDAPVADFNADDACQGDNTMFVNTSTNGNSSSWTFGDGGTSALMFPSHKYAAAGTFNVNLTILGDRGCTSVKSKTITVNTNPIAAFTAANGCQGTPISFTNTSTGANSYQWQFGSEGTDLNTNPAFSFQNTGTVSVTLLAISSQGCRNEVSKNLDIYSSPRASFGVLNSCVGDQTRFVNYSQNGNSNNWNFGDGGSSVNINPSHQYTSAGTYAVTLTVNNANCMDISVQNITINPLPSSDFSFSKAGRDVNFTATNATAKTYNWSFGDGSQGFIKDPAHKYSTANVQKFSVCLNVSDNNGCVSETCKDVNIDLLNVDDLNTANLNVIVYPNPNTGNFRVSIPSGVSNATVVLESLMGVRVAEAVGFDGQTYQFNVEGLSSGVYFVKVSLDGKTKINRVVIEK